MNTKNEKINLRMIQGSVALEQFMRRRGINGDEVVRIGERVRAAVNRGMEELRAEGRSVEEAYAAGYAAILGAGLAMACALADAEVPLADEDLDVAQELQARAVAQTSETEMAQLVALAKSNEGW
jgi:hypothetical protein